MRNQSASLKLFVLFLSGGAIALAIAVHAAEKDKKTKVDVSKLPPASSKQGVTYANDIKAIFDKSCIKCHGPEKPKAKLRLDSLAGALKGSENGKVIEPGKSADSILVHNVAHAGDDQAAVSKQFVGEVVEAFNAISNCAFWRGHKSSMDERLRTVNANFVAWRLERRINWCVVKFALRPRSSVG